jgi:hypothetical protein
MKLRINTHFYVSAVVSIIFAIVFFIFSQLFNEITIFYLGIPFALSIFFFSLAVLSRDSPQWTFKIANIQIIEIFLYALTASSIILVLFVPAYEGSMLEWMKIPPLNWLRYLSSLLLTSFLPGYFLLKILDRKNALETGIVIVLSYLLSLFITFLAGFSILLSSNSLSSLELPLIIEMTVFLSIAHYITHRKKTKNSLVTLNWLELGLILSLLAVIVAGSIILMVRNLPLTSGDMQNHYGTALNFLRGFAVYGGKMIVYQGGYLFAVYLDGLFVLSGIPPALAEQGLYILSFMPFLAFYSSIKAWFGERFEESRTKRLPLIATSLSILLGFGGLYVLYLRFADPAFNIVQLLSSATSTTYDIGMRVLYLPDIVAPLWNIGLPVFFTLLYFLKKDSSSLKAIIIPLLVALGYMGHTSEVIIFLIIAFIYSLFFRKSKDARIGPYLGLGLIVTAIMDFAAPVQMFVLSGVGTGLSFPFAISLILAVLTIVTELVKDKCTFLFSMNFRASLLETLRRSWKYGKWVLIYIYIFFFVTWLAIENNFNLWTWGGYNFTPFFVFPWRFGAVGLLAIISIFIYFSEITRNRRLFFFLSLIPVGFALEQLANYYLPYYPAYRYATIAFVGACIIAGYGIIRVTDKLQRSPKLKVIVSVLLGFLIISGMLTTALFYVNASYYSTNSKISQGELDALDYIRQNIMSNESVLTFTTESVNELENFAGLNVVQDAQRWSELLLSTSNPYIITDILSSSNIKYIYVAQTDVKLLTSSMLNSVVKYFPQVFKNDYATIYAVPPLTAPSPEASLGVLDFSHSLTFSAPTSTWSDDSFLQGWGFYESYGNVSAWSAHSDGNILNLRVTSNQNGDTWVSYSLPLDLKTKDSSLSFRYKVENDYTWFTLILQNASNRFFFYEGHLTDQTFTTKTFSLPDGQDITRVELIVETTDDAPPQTTAVAQIESVGISSQPYSQDDGLPSLFVSLLHSNYTVTYIDDVLLKNIAAYLKSYTQILLPSDPTVPVGSLLQWVSAGNTLIVFNTDGNGYFSNLLGINSSSPLLSMAEMDSGKVVYVNLFPLIGTGNEPEILQPDFLENFRVLLNLQETPTRINVLPVYNSISGSIQVKGDLQINTDALMLQSATGFAGLPLPLNESSEIEFYGKISLTVKNSTFLIYPSESYMQIKPENYPIEAAVSLDNSSNAMIVTGTSNNYQVEAPAFFKFNTTNLPVYARLPSVNATGTIDFDQLDVHASLYVPLAGIVQQPAEVQGSVKFDSLYISNPITIFSMFQAEGKILNLAETTSSPPTIPWIEVLTSPYNIAFNAIFVVGLVFYTIKKERQNKFPKPR